MQALPRSYPLRSRHRSCATAEPLRLTDLMEELIESFLPRELLDAARVAATCRVFYKLWRREGFVRRLILPDRPMRSHAEYTVLCRLASAGNPAACFRLGIACVYESLSDFGYDEGVKMLRSIAESDPSDEASAGLVGDALFELWHLTRNGDERDDILRRAADAGHVAALIELHGTSKERLNALGLSRPLEPSHVFSPAWIAASSRVLAGPTAMADRALTGQWRHYCDRPGCVRWRFRKKEVRRREAAGLSPAPYIRLWKCGRCRCACYCSKACQTLAWPRPHREECDRHLGLQPHIIPTPPTQ